MKGLLSTGPTLSSFVNKTSIFITTKHVCNADQQQAHFVIVMSNTIQAGIAEHCTGTGSHGFFGIP